MDKFPSLTVSCQGGREDITEKDGDIGPSPCLLTVALVTLTTRQFSIRMLVSAHQGTRPLLHVLAGLLPSFVPLSPLVSVHFEHMDLEGMESVITSCLPDVGVSHLAPPGLGWEQALECPLLTICFFTVG